MMRRRYMVAILCAGMIFASSAWGEVVDKISVIVNSEAVTQREIDRALIPIYEKYRAVYYGDELIKKLEEARQKVVEQLVEDKLILGEAKRLGVEVTDKDIDERVGDIMKQFPTKEQFLIGLAQQGLTMKDLRQRYRDQTMQKRLVDSQVGSRVTISPAEVSEYYKAHTNDFIRPEEVKISNILIRPRQDLEPEAALKLAQDIRARIVGGEDFGSLAKQYSEGPNAEEGGAMGFVKRGDLLPEIENVVFVLKAGDVSDILQTSLGYHIFKIEERRERRTVELSQVRAEVEEAIYRQKIKGFLKDWIEGLRKNAYIEFR